MSNNNNIKKQYILINQYQLLRVTKHGAFSTTQKLSVKVRTGSRKIHHNPKKHGKFD